MVSLVPRPLPAAILLRAWKTVWELSADSLAFDCAMHCTIWGGGAICCMEVPENRCAFCAGSCSLRLRRNLCTILRSGGPLSSFLRTIWPALWRQLSASTHTVYVCRLYCQVLDTGANCFSSLKQSIVTLKQSLASSRFYPLASRTTAILSYPASLATSSSTLRKCSGSTEIPSKETLIAALLATMVHTSIYSHVGWLGICR